MLRMVFEIVMALAVIFTLFFLTKISSMDNKAEPEDDKESDKDE